MTRPRVLHVVGPVLLLGAALLAGCEDDPGPAGSKAGSDGRTPAAVRHEADFPGLHLTGEVGSHQENPHRLQLVTGLDCARLRDMVAAGQWRVAERLELGPEWKAAAGLLALVGQPEGDLLQRGDTLIFAEYSGTEGCQAWLNKLPRAELTLKGSGLPGGTQGWVFTRCAKRDEAKLDVTVSFNTDQRVGGLITMRLSRTASGYELTAEDREDLSPILLTHPGNFLAALGKLIAAGEDQPPPPGVTLHELSPTESAQATVEVTGPDKELPAGTVDMSGLESDKGTIAMSIPFACTGLSR